MDRNCNTIRNKIVELCEEDDYGSWELWWAITADHSNIPIDTLRQKFIVAVGRLVESRSIVAKVKGVDGKCLITSFFKERLQEEISNASQPNPDDYYWFGTPKG